MLVEARKAKSLYMQPDKQVEFDKFYDSCKYLHYMVSSNKFRKKIVMSLKLMCCLFGRMEQALASRGLVYVSFKYGVEKQERNGRFFTDMTEEKMENLLEKSESYKLFWFQAIVNKAIAGRESLSYNELIDDMIADSWYMVSEYKLNLGPAHPAAPFASSLKVLLIL